MAVTRNSDKPIFVSNKEMSESYFLLVVAFKIYNLVLEAKK